MLNSLSAELNIMRLFHAGNGIGVNRPQPEQEKQ